MTIPLFFSTTNRIIEKSRVNVLDRMSINRVNIVEILVVPGESLAPPTPTIPSTWRRTRPRQLCSTRLQLKVFKDANSTPYLQMKKNIYIMINNIIN